jgi:hypothetical protein
MLLHARFEPQTDSAEVPNAGRRQAPCRELCSGSVGKKYAADGTLCRTFDMTVPGLQLPRPFGSRAGSAYRRPWWVGCLPGSSSRSVIHVSVTVTASLAVCYEQLSDSVHVKVYALSGSISTPGASILDDSLQAAMRVVRLQFELQLDGVDCDMDMDLRADGAGVRVVNPAPVQRICPRCAIPRAAPPPSSAQQHLVCRPCTPRWQSLHMLAVGATFALGQGPPMLSLKLRPADLWRSLVQAGGVQGAGHACWRPKHHSVCRS